MTPVQASLKQYLVTLASFYGTPPNGYTYSSPADLIIDRGAFDGAHEDLLTAEQKAFVKYALRGTRAQYKQCFGNSQRLALSSARFTYREGYALGRLVPLVHAWVLLDNQHVIDVTWRDKAASKQARRIRGVVPEGWAYMGVTPPGAADREQLRERLIRIKQWASYLDNDIFDDFEQRELYQLPRISPG